MSVSLSSTHQSTCFRTLRLSLTFRMKEFIWMWAFPLLSVCFCTGEASPYLYETCANPKCNFTLDFDIKYPFGLAEGCGNPHFQMKCLGYHAVLSIKGQIYRVLKADYNERRIKIVDEMVSASKCYLPNGSTDLTGSPFHLAQPYCNLTFLLDCKQTIQNFTSTGCKNNSYMGFAEQGLRDLSKNNNCSTKFQVQTRKVEQGDFPGNVKPEYIRTRIYEILRRGFELEWKGEAESVEITSCESSKGICGYNATDPQTPFLCLCGDGPRSRNCFKRSETCSQLSHFHLCGNPASCIGGGVGIGVVAAVFISIRLKRRKQGSKPSARSHNGFNQSEMANLSVFSYQQLEEATNYFDEKRELGDGGFGSVYLGQLQDGRTVAVKRLHQENSRRLEQFVNEVRIISSVRHTNLVRFFGCCQDRRNLLLVYEYVPNGTLADHLHGKKRPKGLLGWETRLNIALETANALAYLHFGIDPPIFHRDVKSTNILLDENLRVKVADFGLSRLVPTEATHVSTVPQGTPGYLDPNYHECYQLTDKSDVYSFGVVLIEIISAKKAVDITRDTKEISLAHLATSKIQSGALHELIDTDLEFESNPMVRAMVTSVAELAFVCLALEKDDRPCMTEVVTQLQRIKQMGYSCQNCRNFCGSNRDTCKFVTLSPTSVQGATWSSTSPSPEISA
eukprot:Gb_36292 [translate_table: standard]